MEAKRVRLRVLEASDKPLEVEKLRRQIDTHEKLMRQARQEKEKIQEKLDKL